LRTGDEAVDFAETWSALGDTDGVERLWKEHRLTKAVRALGGWRPSRVATTDVDGTFEIAIPRGALSFVLEARSEGLLALPDEPFLIDTKDLTRRFLVILDPAVHVKGQVVDAGGVPVEGAWVSSSRSNVWGCQYADAFPFPTRTDVSGDFELTAAEPPYYVETRAPEVDVEHAAYPPRSCAMVPVDSGRVRQRIRLESPRAVEALVLDELGNPAEGVDVMLDPKPFLGFFDAWHARSNASGRVRWPAVAAGNYGVRALQSDVWIPLAVELIDVPRNGSAPVPTVRVAARAVGDKDGGAGDSPSTSRPRIRIVALDRATRERIPEFEALALTDSGARGVLPTTYWKCKSGGEVPLFVLPTEIAPDPALIFVIVRTPGYVSDLGGARKKLALDAPIEVLLDRECVVRGVVKDSIGGAPVGGAEIRWREAPDIGIGLGRYQTVSLADGSFELRGLPPGSIRVIARRTGRAECFSSILNLKPGEVRELDPLVLTAG
jgi:hypothetical protein